jgi:hypothetical protein
VSHRGLLLALLLIAPANAAAARLTLPTLFGDHIVLQPGCLVSVRPWQDYALAQRLLHGAAT